MNASEVLGFAVKYWAQLFALASLPVAALKLVLDRGSKRDELRYNGLVSIRNAEIKNYSQAVGVLFSRLNTLTVVINNDPIELKSLLAGLLAVHEDLTKCYISLIFLLPRKDKDGLEAFNKTVSDVCMEYIQLLSGYLNNRISLAVLESSLVGLRPKVLKASDDLDKSSLLVERMVSKHLGI